MRESEFVTATLAETIALHERVKHGDLGPVTEAAAAIIEALGQDGRLLTFGNGGSAADAQHVAAELVGRFQRERRSLAAIALTTDTSVLTSVGNDYSFDRVFARQIEGLGRTGDVALGISTSGRSPNVIAGVQGGAGARPANHCAHRRRRRPDGAAGRHPRQCAIDVHAARAGSASDAAACDL